MWRGWVGVCILFIYRCTFGWNFHRTWTQFWSTVLNYSFIFDVCCLFFQPQHFMLSDEQVWCTSLVHVSGCYWTSFQTSPIKVCLILVKSSSLEKIVDRPSWKCSSCSILPYKKIHLDSHLFADIWPLRNIKIAW